jgi:hypothetical protein
MIGINFYMTLEGLYCNEFLSNLGGLHMKQAVQRGIWVPTQHLLHGRGKPRKTLVDLAGPDAN